MVSRSLVVGYHGCDVRLARKIISLQENFKPSQNAWDWLGHGIYFWEDSPFRARRWAEEENRQSSERIKQPAVVGAIIDLGNCLNLADAAALAQVRVAHDAYLQICDETGVSVARNRGDGLRARYLDCAVMETLHELRQQENSPPVETVRAFFMEGRELYPGAGFRELDHIQICVRKPKQIIGCFWVPA